MFEAPGCAGARLGNAIEFLPASDQLAPWLCVIGMRTGPQMLGNATVGGTCFTSEREEASPCCFHQEGVFVLPDLWLQTKTTSKELSLTFQKFR